MRVPAVAILLIALGLGGCTTPTTVVALGGALDVLGPDPTFAVAVNGGRLPDGWTVDGTVRPRQLVVRELGGVRALSVGAGDTPFAFVRLTRASLLATPFLHWAWNVSPPTSGPLPIRVVVGLSPRDADRDGPWWRLSGTEPPPVSRLIQIEWNDTALGRGTVVGPIREDGHPESARYIARGGPEQGGRWYSDSVDLSLVEKQIWPADNQADLEIRFIGVTVRPGDGTLDIAAIRLTR